MMEVANMGSVVTYQIHSKLFENDKDREMAKATAAEQREYYRYYFKALRLAGLVGVCFFALGFVFFNLLAASAAGIVATGLAYDKGMAAYFEIVRKRVVSGSKCAQTCRCWRAPDTFDDSDEIIMGGPFSVFSDRHYDPFNPHQNFW